MQKTLTCYYIDDMKFNSHTNNNCNKINKNSKKYDIISPKSAIRGHPVKSTYIYNFVKQDLFTTLYFSQKHIIQTYQRILDIWVMTHLFILSTCTIIYVSYPAIIIHIHIPKPQQNNQNGQNKYFVGEYAYVCARQVTAPLSKPAYPIFNPHLHIYRKTSVTSVTGPKYN